MCLSPWTSPNKHFKIHESLYLNSGNLDFFWIEFCSCCSCWLTASLCLSAQWERLSPSDHYVLGEPMYFEAEALSTSEDERLYLHSCYATRKMSDTSTPQFPIVTNFGWITTHWFLFASALYSICHGQLFSPFFDKGVWLKVNTVAQDSSHTKTMWWDSLWMPSCSRGWRARWAGRLHCFLYKWSEYHAKRL